MIRGILGNVVTQITLIILLTFLLQIYAASQGVMAQYFILSYPFDQYPWTIVTSIFAHAGQNHLISNIAGLIIFGLPVAWKASKIRFYFFFLTVGAISGLTQVMVIQYLSTVGVVESSVGVLGASGAIFGLAGYWITSNAFTKKTTSYFPVSSKIRYTLYLIVATWITLATASPETAIIAHFTGFMLGLILGRSQFLRK